MCYHLGFTSLSCTERSVFRAGAVLVLVAAAAGGDYYWLIVAQNHRLTKSDRKGICSMGFDPD